MKRCPIKRAIVDAILDLGEASVSVLAVETGYSERQVRKSLAKGLREKVFLEVAGTLEDSCMTRGRPPKWYRLLGIPQKEPAPC